MERRVVIEIDVHMPILRKVSQIFATKIVDVYRGLELPCAVPSINKVSDQESNKNSTDSHTHDGAKR